MKTLSLLGMELEVDMIMSKTVFHAVRQQEGAGLKGSVVYLDSSADIVDADIWRFLQMAAEVIGLRHGKYKDALIQLEKRKDVEAGILGWRPNVGCCRLRPRAATWPSERADVRWWRGLSCRSGRV